MKRALWVAIAALLLSSATSTNVSAQPAPGGLAKVTLRGLVVLIDFSDAPAKMPLSRAEAIINGVGYTEPTVTRSLRDYWYDQSRGKVDFSHEVVGYYRAPQPAAWYQTQPWQESVALMRAALEWTAATHLDLDWDALSLASGPMNRNGTEEGTFLAISFMLTTWTPGAGGTHWLLGFTAPNGVPTQQVVAATFDAPWEPVEVNLFWLTHELGHSVWGWPDTYDNTGKSHGTGIYSLMSGNDGTGDIEPPGAPFLLAEGWVDPIEITTTQTIALKPDGGAAARYYNPADAREYFVVEARREATIGNSRFPVPLGLLIWHIDERVTTNNTHPERTPALHYRVSIEQADGAFDLEEFVNPGDAGDIYVPGLAFSALTTPDSNWWDGSASFLGIDDIRFTGEGRISFRASVTPVASAGPHPGRGSVAARVKALK